MNFRWYRILACATVLTACGQVFADGVSLRVGRGHVAIEIDGAPFARYVFGDEAIRRPYLMDVRTLSGVAVTRTHPPREGVDATDHATMHPGIWLAFGDIGGVDFWRNGGRVVHESFAGNLETGADLGRFSVKNAYFDGESRICEETSTVSIHVRDARIFLIVESVFESDTEIAFGDQEEMGLGVRVATPLTVDNGGEIRNSDGMINEAGCWGKQALWAEYSGIVDGERVAVVLMPHPENFGPSWFHARDYGLLVANPFGRRAFTSGEASRVEVRAGEAFRLGFGVCVYTGEPAAEEAYASYLAMTGARADEAGTGGEMR